MGAEGAVAPLLVEAEYKVGELDPKLFRAVIENWNVVPGLRPYKRAAGELSGMGADQAPVPILIIRL